MLCCCVFLIADRLCSHRQQNTRTLRAYAALSNLACENTFFFSSLSRSLWQGGGTRSTRWISRRANPPKKYDSKKSLDYTLILTSATSQKTGGNHILTLIYSLWHTAIVAVVAQFEHPLLQSRPRIKTQARKNQQDGFAGSLHRPTWSNPVVVRSILAGCFDLAGLDAALAARRDAVVDGAVNRHRYCHLLGCRLGWTRVDAVSVIRGVWWSSGTHAGLAVWVDGAVMAVLNVGS